MAKYWPLVQIVSNQTSPGVFTIHYVQAGGCLSAFEGFYKTIDRYFFIPPILKSKTYLQNRTIKGHGICTINIKANIICYTILSVGINIKEIC
jgi:hypothetical protein